MGNSGWVSPGDFGDGALPPAVSTPTGLGTNALDFSQASNSQYWFFCFLV